eukprot:Skav211795  [mRNA]  locus=scaffold305:303622:303852:- [translate_table: standard]
MSSATAAATSFAAASFFCSSFHADKGAQEGFSKHSLGKSKRPPLAPPLLISGITQAPFFTANLASFATPGPPSTDK